MHTRNDLARRLLAAGVTFCWMFSVNSPAIERNSSYRAALESIHLDQLREHVDYLADDELQGREAGRRGGRTAGDYLASQLRKLNLRGAGADGGYFQPFAPNYRNVLALLPGSDPEIEEEVIVVCAHYDHVGYGNRRNSRGSTGYVHNGADDNASGTSVLLELAEALTTLPQAPRRSILFAFWDAEEKGLLGAKHWVGHPTLPRDNVAALLNMDMVGRMRNDRLTIFGSRSGFGWRRLISYQNEGPALRLEFSWMLKPAADHYPFCQRGIPVLMFHTGVHDDYHTPRDDANLINHAGMQRVGRLLFHLVCDLADRPETPAFRRACHRETERTRKRLAAEVSKPTSRLGVRWRRRQSPGEGLLLVRVLPGSAAARAGLRAGDRILQFAGRPIHVDDDLRLAVMSAESPATVLIERGGAEEPEELAVQLDGRPLRLGVKWREDAAEPGTAILTYVVAGSPAARAGLRIGDRIHEIAGHDFTDRAEFVELATSLPEPLELLVERDGQLRIVVVKSEAEGPENAV